jgi:predicted CXXCH cytochrome family protein
MEVDVTLLTRRGAAVMRRLHRISVDRVRFGRGTDNDVPLSDIRVELAAAMLSARDGTFVVETLSGAPLRVNGRSVQIAPVRSGDEILIGPYRIQITEPPAGCDAALSVELALAPANTLAAGTRIGLSSGIFGKRTMSWSAFLVVAAVCLAGPIVVYVVGLVPSWRQAPPKPGLAGLVALSWNAGQLSNPHRQFAVDCASCHQAAFVAVSDTACLACHAGVGAHADPHADLGAMRDTLAGNRCADCHQEHRGVRGLVLRDASLCLECHRNLAEDAPRADLRNVTGFPAGHPQFRATLVADAAAKAFVRREIGGDPAPGDRPGLHFSHAAHLMAGGFPALGYREMVCADCHVAERSGQGFLPITYKGQCQSCHELKFDRADLPWPDATVPHGDDSGIVAAVWNFYAGKALQGALPIPAMPPPVERRAAGAPPPTESPPADTQAWVRERAEAALRGVVLDPKRGCAYCHFGTGPDGAFETSRFLPAPMMPAASAQMRIVAPVLMETRFLPNARFDHAKHAASSCDDCHDARRSQSAGDLLIPGEQNCLRCHGAEGAALKAQSTCITCHVFHRTDFGPMHPTAAATQ